jgi:hypothetical protein
VAGGWVDRGMAQVVPDPDSAWVAEEWVEAAEAALAVVGAAGVAAPEGVVQVAAACGNLVAGPGVEAEELGAEAARAEEVGPGAELAVPVVPVGLAVVEVEAAPVAAVLVAPGDLGVEAGPVAVVAEDTEVDLDPAVDPERAPEGREPEAKRIRQGNG